MQSLEDILKSDSLKNRRDFLKEISIVSGSLFLPNILGCSDGGSSTAPVISEEPRKPATTENHGNYELFQSSTNNDGIITLVNKKGDDVTIRVIDESGDGVGGGIEVMYYENNHGTIFIGTLDPFQQYLPGFRSMGDLGKSGLNKQQGLIEIVNYPLNANRYINLAYKFFRDDKFNFRHKDTLIRVPGIQHWGDFSFNDIRNFNLFLNTTAVIIFPVFPEVGGPLLAGTTTVEHIMKHLDEFINILNIYGLEVDKNEQFEFYYLAFPPGRLISFFLPKISLNIRDYIDTSQGNWWRYKVPGESNLLEIKVQGYRNIDGKNVPALKQSNGITIYQGYDDNELKTYGFEVSGTFIRFTNPVVVGDNSLWLNKTYSTNTSISGIPDITITDRYIYEKLEVLKAKRDLSYRCWRMKDEARDSTGNYVYQNVWLAKKIGQIKIYNPSIGTIRLVEAYVNGKHHTGFESTLMKEEQIDPREKVLIGAGPLISYRLHQ